MFLRLFLLALLAAAAQSAAPLALHQLVEVAIGGDVTITLKGYDLDNDSVRAEERKRGGRMEGKEMCK
jgi:hypothetical protein